MDWTVCSRETERDYTWNDIHASHPVAEYSRNIFAPAFEGSLTTSRFAALLRYPGSPQGVVLGVSVSTTRKDLSHCPIRTLAFLRGETPEETDLLAAFFAECLRKPDSETLYNAESGIAKAVESLYQTKKPDDFLRFCHSLPTANGSGLKPTVSCVLPRDFVNARLATSDSLPALIKGGEPFLIALTDRASADVLASLGSMFYRRLVYIFSKPTTAVEELPQPASKKNVLAAAIGGVALLAALLVAAGRSCRNGSISSDTPRGTNVVERTDSGGINAANVVPNSGRGGKSDGGTSHDDSSTNAIATFAEAKVMTMTNRVEQSVMPQ